MNPISSEPDMERGKKRKIDSDGFTCPNTPDVHRMPFFMNSAYTNDGTAEAEQTGHAGYGSEDREVVKSEYFQPAEHGNITSTQSATERLDGQQTAVVNEAETAANSIPADYHYEESQPGDVTTQLYQEKVDNYHYISHPERQFEPNYTSDYTNSGEKPQEPDKLVPSFSYDSSEVQGAPETSYYQHQRESTGQPNASGAATANTVYNGTLKHVEDVLKIWKQERDELFEYWSGIFRLSNDYEEKAVEKLSMLIEKAKALDQTMLQHREAVTQRVQGIGKILQLQ